MRRIVYLNLDNTLLLEFFKTSSNIEEVLNWIKNKFINHGFISINNEYYISKTEISSVYLSVLLMQLGDEFNNKYGFLISNIIKKCESFIIKEEENYLPLLFKSDELLK